ncbi:MAG: MFS transporter [Candidatus Izimaplasma sp.]|nr:MFS transporter [Candidatus Izimaplasma bacterium]
MKLSKKEKFGYGFGDLSSNIIFASISFYLLYFMVSVAGLDPKLAGLVFIIGKFWDAITDYLMGVISDKTTSKFGKRRIYMLFGAIPYGLIFILLWITPFSVETSQFIKFLYYTCAFMFFNTVWTVVYVPYNALTANMTKDYDERTSLNGFRIIFANIGLLLGAAIFALLAEGEGSIFAELFNSVKTGYTVASALFGVIAMGIMITSALMVRERFDSASIYNKPLLKTIKEFFSMKEFRSTMMYYLLSMVGFDIIMAVFLFFVNDSLGFARVGGGEISMVFIALPLICAIGSAMFWVKQSEKYDKVKVYSYAVVWISIALIACIFIPKYNAANPFTAYFFLGLTVILVGIGMSAVQILPFASIPDVVEVDEYYHGIRREGAYYGIVSFVYKVASGISIALIGLILGAFGYIESIDGAYIAQPESALIAIRLTIGILPGIIFFVSVIYGKRAKLDRKQFNLFKKEIKLRKNSN